MGSATCESTEPVEERVSTELEPDKGMAGAGEAGMGRRALFEASDRRRSSQKEGADERAGAPPTGGRGARRRRVVVALRGRLRVLARARWSATALTRPVV